MPPRPSQRLLRTPFIQRLGPRPLLFTPRLTACIRPALSPYQLRRGFAGKSSVDEKVDEISEQFAIARDEFEIATEETEKSTVYAAGDRATARAELQKLETLVAEVSEEDAGEVNRRVGQRVRELKNAVEELNKADEKD